MGIGLQKMGILTLLTCPLLFSCSFSKNPEDKKPAEPVIIQQVSPTSNMLVDGDFKLEVVSESPFSVNEYKAQLSWNSKKESLLKIFVGNSEQPITTLNSKDSSSYSIDCISGSSLRIRILVYPTSQILMNELIEREVYCPTDIEISGRQSISLQDIKKIGKLFIHDGAVASLGGTSLDLEVQTLVIDHVATIETYDQYTSLKNEESTHIPHINLHIDNVLFVHPEDISRLEFKLVGLDGKDGRSGDELGDLDSSFKAEKSRKRDGSNGEDGYSRLNYGTSDPTVFNCQKNSTNGGDGRDGVQGYSGEDGANGMDSPPLKLVFKNPTNLFIDVTKIPGKKGLGGNGGKAIPPGNAGRGGITGGDGNKRDCPSGRAGKPGVGKPDGNSGTDGYDGNEGSHSVQGTTNYQVRIFQK